MPRPKRTLIATINVVPYIDVMLVLLIIFMITAPLLNQGFEVDLPKASANSIQTKNEREPAIMTVDHAGRVYLNHGANPDTPILETELLQRLAAIRRLYPEITFLIRGDGRVAYAEVVHVMALLHEAGIDKVGLVTTPGEPLLSPEKRK